MGHHEGMDRRGFLRTGLAAATLAGAAGAQEAAAPSAAEGVKRIEATGTLPVRPFGKTGLTLPILGHGGSALMAKEYPYYGLTEVPSREDRVRMIRDAYEKGIRYFDTARIYHESEELFGEALRDVRDKVFLASKVLVGKPEDVRKSVEASLEALGMDAIDCFQIHGPTVERLRYDGCMKLYEELVKLRDEGLCRYIGFTGHDAFDVMYELAASGAYDSMLIEYGHFQKGYQVRHSEAQIQWRDAAVAKAHEQGMAIIAMKVLGAWVYNHNAKNMVPEFPAERVARLPGAAIRWALRDTRIAMYNIGVSYPDDMDKNIAIFTGDTAFTEEDRMLLAEFAARAYQHPSIQELPVA